MSLLLLVESYLLEIWFSLIYHFDIILGINWLCTYGAKIKCKDLKVILTDKKGREVCLYGQKEKKPCLIIFSMKESKFIMSRVY